MEISHDDLMILDEQADTRVLVPGEYEFCATFSSRDIRAVAVASVP